MSKFYTFVGLQGNTIHHRYIDNSGDRRTESVSSFPIQLYLESPKGTYSSFDSKKVGRVDFTSISDAKEFIDKYDDVTPVYGQTSLVHQFISHTYSEHILFDINLVRIAIIDIETNFEDGFPYPWIADQEITSISFKFRGNSTVYSFSRAEFEPAENVKFYKVFSEKQLLQTFIQVWSEMYPDIITGYNVSGFDVPYLVNRCLKILPEEEVNRLSPFHKKTKKVFRDKQIKGSDEKTIQILGITVLDYLELYKKYSRTTLEKYTLDFVAYHELGEKKTDYSEYGNLNRLYSENPQLYMEYNIRDVTLVEDLDSKLGFIFIALTVTYLAKIRHEEVYSPVKFWDNYVYTSLEKKGVVIPPANHGPQEVRGIKGGFVKEPVPGKYNWAVSFDLTSLYPSIIMAFGLSPETIQSKATGNYVQELVDFAEDLTHLYSADVAMTANGAKFSRGIKGILPELTEGMFSDRKKHKKEMLDLKAKIERGEIPKEDIKKVKDKIASLSAMEQAIKIALNSLYGAQANAHFRYFNEDIAEGITLTGQLIIQYISKHLNLFLNEQLKNEDKKEYVIMSDTDSVFINFQDFIRKIGAERNEDINKVADVIDTYCRKEVEPFIARKFKELGEYLNVASSGKIHMKREKIANSLIVRAKKNYVIQVIDSEGVRYSTPAIVPVGIEIVRSSTPEFVRNKLLDGVQIMLNSTEESLQMFVKEVKAEFMLQPIDAVAFPRSVSNLDKWKKDSWSASEDPWQLKTPLHVKASIVYNDLLRRAGLAKHFPLIRNGNKIKFIYLKQPNPVRSNAIAFLDVIHSEFNLDSYIDKDEQFARAFLKPLRSLADILHWGTEPVNKLSDLFCLDLPPQPEPRAVERKLVSEPKQVDKPVVAKERKPPQVKKAKQKPVTLTDLF